MYFLSKVFIELCIVLIEQNKLNEVGYINCARSSTLLDEL